jgi:hypothetical protein
MCDEEWKDIPGYPDHQASSEGRIRNVRRGQILTGTVTRRGYRQYNLRGVRGRKVVFGHRLVASAFLGPPPPAPGNLVNHLDTNKLNNRPENLEYTDPRGNVRHAAAHGLIKPVRLLGEQNPNSKLTAEQVREMRALHQQGAAVAALAKQFGVTTRCGYRVIRRKDWKHVA